MFKIICIVFWLCVVKILIDLVMVFRGRILRVVPVVGGVVAAGLMLAVIALITTKGNLAWYESGAKSLADNVFPSLASQIAAMVAKIRASIGGTVSSVLESVRNFL